MLEKAEIDDAEFLVFCTHKHDDGVSTLAQRLCRRYERRGQLADLDAAKTTTEMALLPASDDQDDLANIVNDLLIRLNTRSGRKYDTEELKKALNLANMVVGATPGDHLEGAMHLSNLS